MKKLIPIEILRKLRAKPNLMRKVKIFAAVGVVGFLVTSGFVIWAGISAFSYVAGRANEVIQSPQASAHLENLKSEVQLSKFQALGCWDKAQTLMAVEPWLEKPALENLRNLKLACLDERPAVCEGQECTQVKQLLKTAEGRAI